METLTIKKGEFSHHASRYLSVLEQKGGSILITSRGKPIARITPADTKKDWALSRLRVLKQDGDINEPVLPLMEL